MRNSALLALVAGALAFTVAQVHETQTPTDLSGSWQMDKAHSQYPAEGALETIQQHDGVIDIIVIETWSGRARPPMHLHLTADGKPATSMVGGNRFTSTTHWEKGKLVTLVEDGRGQHMTETRELSSDGNTLTVTGYHQDELAKPHYVRVMKKAAPQSQS